MTATTLKRVPRAQLVQMWIFAVLAIMALRVVGGVDVTAGTGTLWLLAATLPPAGALLAWHLVPRLAVAPAME